MVKKNTAGWTLVEAMMVVAIIGIIASVTPQILVKVTQFFILSRVRVELQREARETMTVITKNLRQGTYDTIRIDQVSGQPYYSRITFTKDQGTVVSYYQSGTRLIQTTGTGASTKSYTLTQSLSYLAFTFPRSDDMTIVSVSLTLEKGIYEGLTKALHMASEKVQVMN